MWRGEGGRFYSEVWVYGSHVATFIADTPDELVKMVNDVHGYE
jgi:hypothetical protein